MADSKKLDKETKVASDGSTITPTVIATSTPRPVSGATKNKWKTLGNKSTRELLSPTPPPKAGAVKANGSASRPPPALIRTDSLSVPVSTATASKEPLLGDDKETRDNPGEGKGADSSRRSSERSLESRISNVDFSKLQSAPVVSAKKEKEEKGAKNSNSVLTDDSYIRSVIPYLPQSLAVVCLILNVLIPGTGTMVSGFSVFCCGKTRVQSKEGHTMTTFCVNVMVGFMQLFTVPFMLVGWFWSLVWGVYMLILAADYKQEQKEKHEKELQAKALTALNANLRPWTLMRS